MSEPDVSGLTVQHMRILQLHASNPRFEWYPGTRDREIQDELRACGFLTSAMTKDSYTVTSSGMHALAILRDELRD